MEIFIIIGIVLLIGFYFLPFLYALDRCHSKTPAIFILNLLLGWTFIGWVIALVWAFTENNKEKGKGEGGIFEEKDPETKENNSIADIEKLAELKEKGIITEEEFNKKKKQILGL